MECDNCKAVNHPMSVVPYVNVELCPLHAAAEQMKDALEGLLPYLSTEAQLLDYASLNEGQASSFDTASVKARAALSAAKGE